MKKGEMLSKMLLTATKAHEGQFDKGGNPYILHPLRVMYTLKSDDEELNCIALGHDLIEDTYVTYEMLATFGFTPRVVEGIKCLTKVNGETHSEYMQKVMSNKDSMKVKLQDLRHNSDIRRLKGVRDKDIARMARYHSMYVEIKENLGE